MKEYSSEQVIDQLEKRKGGYYYLKIDSDVVNQFDRKNKTRFICQLDGILDFQCGLNHLGDGHYFIILSTKNLDAINKNLGDKVKFRLTEDPNPLGVEIPEVLLALLEQDEDLKDKFEKLTDGKKRNVIHQIIRIKAIDLQISRSIELINNASMGKMRKLR